MILISFGDSTLPLYLEIYQQLRQKIQSGELVAGTKLPSKRAFASQLGVSVNTVDGAYGQLLSEGFVDAMPKSGYFVNTIDRLEYAEPKITKTCANLPTIETIAYDFSPSGIAHDRFPFSVWQKILKNALEEKDILSRTHFQGDLSLREAVAEYLHGSRGVRCSGEQIVIGAGTDALLSIISYILPNSCTMAVENPVYNKAYELFARMGHQVVPAEIDKLGVLVQPLQAFDHMVLYTTPSHQYPLGLSMPMGRRVKLLNWASGGEFRYIIEDDYDSEFRYDAKPVPSLQSIDHNNRVIYLGTFSQSVAPSLRVSYMVLPPALLSLYTQIYGKFSTGVSTLEQVALREFYRNGHFETHLNRMRVHYKNKRKRLVELLKPLEGQIHPIGETAGHHLTVKSDKGWSEMQLCESARLQGVKVYPISPYFIGQCPYEGKVILGFGGLSEQQLHEGAARLVQAWKK